MRQFDAETAAFFQCLDGCLGLVGVNKDLLCSTECRDVWGFDQCLWEGGEAHWDVWLVNLKMTLVCLKHNVVDGVEIIKRELEPSCTIQVQSWCSLYVVHFCMFLLRLFAACHTSHDFKISCFKRGVAKQSISLDKRCLWRRFVRRS